MTVLQYGPEDQKFCKRHNNGLGAWVSVWNFYKNSKAKDGLHSFCSDCDKARSKKWTADNRDKRAVADHNRRARIAKAKGTITRKQYNELLEQYPYCLKCKSTDRLTLDHIIPLEWGGDNLISNAQVLCLSCNTSKKHYHATDYRPLAAKGTN